MKNRTRQNDTKSLLAAALLIALGATSCGGSKDADGAADAAVANEAVWDHSDWDEAVWQ